MFFFAILLGIYSYIIFLLGILGWLYQWVIVGVTIAFALLSHHVIKSSGHKVTSLLSQILEDLKTFDFRLNPLMTLFGVLLALQALVNLIGVLGPELGFDALWYHLTLPKLYLINHGINFIPGGLLYYSAMPKLAEMFYTAGLFFGNENIVKFIHYSFGLLTCLALYKLGRKFFNPLISLIAVVIFYSNLVVGWESTSAYIDLVRAFFEVMALWAFVNWFEERKKKWLILSALMVGLAITTKLLAIGSLVIFAVLILLDLRFKMYDLGRKRLKSAISSYILYPTSYIFIALAVPLPWFIFSYLNTGNPVYPFFTDLYKVIPEPFSVFGFVKDVWILFTQASDPVSFVYILFFSIILFLFLRHSGLSRISKAKTVRFRAILDAARMTKGLSVIAIYSVLAIIIWYFTPRSGGGRFILPYLPAFSLLCAGLIHYVWKEVYLRRALLAVVVAVSVFSICYRFAANWKYIPVIVGKETKQEFLLSHLNFGFGDFYDTDGYFAKHIKSTDKVLLYGFHNLYYVDFPFVEASTVGEIRDFGKVGGINYIAVQNGALPEMYKEWKLVYSNRKTMVNLYRKL